MSAVAGWIMPTPGAPSAPVLEAMTDALAHRGPDGEGHVHRGSRDGAFRVALGHRRLAVIDAMTGGQPMSDARGEVWVVCDGAIHNHRALRAELEARGCAFRTGSDIEVLLHGWRQWGVGLPERLDGNFAFALWDAARETLFLARDRFGEKPLFLVRRGTGLFFASEIKALLTLPGPSPDIDRAAVWNHLRYGYVPAPGTLFKSIAKLPPAGYLLWRRGQGEQGRFYSPPDGCVPELMPAPYREPIYEPIGGFLATLDSAVESRRMSDSAFGVFLTGTLDSAVLTALASRHTRRPVQSFAIRHRGPRQAESISHTHIRDLAAHFGTEHHDVTFRPEQITEILPRLVASRDSPLSNPRELPFHVLAQAAGKRVKMVLTTEGAPEILAGRFRHWLECRTGGYQALMPPLAHRRLALPLAGLLPASCAPFLAMVENFGLGGAEERLPRWSGGLTRAEARALIDFDEPVGPFGDGSAFATAPTNTRLRRMLFFEQMSLLPDSILEGSERMSMAASVEARTPFLDPRLVAFVSALPDGMRLRRRTGKWLLHEAAGRLLPPALLGQLRPEVRLPLGDWFRGPLQAYLRDQLQGSGSRTRDYYRPAALGQVIDAHCQGRRDHEGLLWNLLGLELFHKHVACPE